MPFTVSRLVVLLSFAASTLVPSVCGQSDGPAFLKPMSMSDFSFTGNEKRTIDYSELDPRESDTFFWGNPTEDSKEFTFANMTLFGIGNERIISMERFKPMLKSVQCGEKTILEFKTRADFEHAIRVWGWVNEDETHSFILFADHPGCGPDDQRQPFYIYNADYDEEGHTAYLYGYEKKWKEVARTFDLDFGRMTSANRNSQTGRSKRWDIVEEFEGVGEDITEGVEEVGEDVTEGVEEVGEDVTEGIEEISEWDVTEGLDLDMSSDFSGNVFTSNSSVLGEYTVDCVECGTSGSVEVTGRIVVDVLEPQEVSLTIVPHGLRADMGVEVHAKTGTSPVIISYSKSVLEIPLPYSINIPEVGTIGFVLKEKIGISTKGNQANADFSFGMGANVSDDAMLRVDLANSENDEFSGWTPDIQTDPFEITGDIKSVFTIYGQTSLGAELSILDWGWEAVVALKIPELTATIDTNPTESAACGGEEGISVDTRIGGTLVLKAGKRGDLAVTVPINTKPLVSRGEVESEWDDFDWEALESGRDTPRSIEGFSSPLKDDSENDIERRLFGVNVEYKIWSRAWDLWSKCFGSSPPPPAPASVPRNAIRRPI